MAMRFSILGSGSSGNSALLQTDHARVLVDAGFSAKRLSAMLEDCPAATEPGLAATMSHYLVQRIDAAPNITLHANTEVCARPDSLKPWSAVLTLLGLCSS